ncbi:MAG: hypothetical protein PHW60_15850 [Kiritimatiellae bacterium]|nr:hypothetical protein [Kiritimatiellia bacterium]
MRCEQRRRALPRALRRSDAHAGLPQASLLQSITWPVSPAPLDQKMKTDEKSKWFHVWATPLLWLPCGILSMAFRGDKNLAFYFATFPGAWMPELLNLHFGLPAFISQATGVLLVVAGLGLAMDLAGVYRRVYVFYVPFALVSALLTIGPGFDLAFLFFALCWTVYLVSIVAIVVGLIRRAIRKRGPTTARTVPLTRGGSTSG